MGLAVELEPRFFEAWDNILETWPDVAQKLRPSPLEMEVTEVPSLEAGILLVGSMGSMAGGTYGGQGTLAGLDWMGPRLFRTYCLGFMMRWVPTSWRRTSTSWCQHHRKGRHAAGITGC